MVWLRSCMFLAAEDELQNMHSLAVPEREEQQPSA